MRHVETFLKIIGRATVPGTRAAGEPLGYHQRRVYFTDLQYVDGAFVATSVS